MVMYNSMSLSAILQPNEIYDLYARSFNGAVSGGNITFDTLTQNNGNSSINLAGTFASNGSININGAVNAVTGFTTAASLLAGVQVSAPILNSSNIITATNDISSVNGDLNSPNGNVNGQTFTNSNSSFTIDALGNIICNSINVDFVKQSLTAAQVLTPSSTVVTLTAAQVLNTIIYSTGVAQNYVNPLPNASTVLALIPDVQNSDSFSFTLAQQGDNMSSLQIVNSADGKFVVNWVIQVDGVNSNRIVRCRVVDRTGAATPSIICY